MKIENLKALEQLIKLCRKTGIDAMEIDGIKFNLGAIPRTNRNSRKVENDIPEANIKIPQYSPIVSEVVADVIKTDALTEEELLFYSARGDQ